jgi:hypothetical protein
MSDELSPEAKAYFPACGRRGKGIKKNISEVERERRREFARGIQRRRREKLVQSLELDIADADRAFMEESNFNYAAWELGHDNSETILPELNSPRLPKRPVSYSPGQDPKIGRNIQAARLKKRDKANGEFFLSEVLPLLKDSLNAMAWHDLAIYFPDRKRDFMEFGDWELWKKDNRQSWIHESDTKKLGRALAIGAQKHLSWGK